MDHQLEVNNALLESINGSVSLFNDLFGNVAPITLTCYADAVEDPAPISNVTSALHSSSAQASTSFSVGQSSSSSSVTVDLSCKTPNSSGANIQNVPYDTFTGSQCLQIQHLSGHLSNIRSSVRRLHILHNRTIRGDKREDSETLTENTFLQSKLIESRNLNALMAMQISAIKNFLVNEINRAEKADELLNLKENLLVEVTVERDEFKKKFMDQNIAWNSRSLYEEQSMYSNFLHRNADRFPPCALRTSIQDPRRNLVGSHIRKEFDNEFFFGLVVLFEYPFYKVRKSFFIL